ncbi:unnamed protein product [Rhizoctonia solani]|nr:unnamed protein product [Rhizoctonia solani]
MFYLSSASTLNPSLAWSMGNGGKGRVKIQFPFDMNWYHEQPCTTFKTLQHRKELRGFRHEFIVLQMTNGSICRIERMGDPDKRFNALGAKGSLAHDFAQMFPSRPDQVKTARLEDSDIVAEITLPVEIDLKHVLYICRALHEGEKTRSYTLQVYNCYFVSLTLQCCLVRRSTRWDYSELFNGWLYHLEKTTSQLQSPNMLSFVHNWNDTRFNPILLRVFSSLSMSDLEDSDVPQTIMKIIQDQLRHRFHPDAAFRQRLQDTSDNELWHSNILAIPHSFIEKDIEQIVLNALRCALDTGCSKLEDATQVARWREWGDALIELISSASVCSKSKLIPSTSTRLPRTRSFSGINNNLTTAIKELDYRGTKAQSEDSELVQDLKNIHQWGSVCLVYFLQFCLWLSVMILSHWGIRLFNWGAVPCIVIEDELDALINKGPVDVTTLDSRIKDLRTLRKSKLAIWLNPPWADLHRTVEQYLVGDLQWIKSGPQEPTFDIKIQGREKQPCSIQVFQSHILDRLEAQAELVESVWLGSAAKIKLELKDRLSEVWALIREDLDPGEVEIQSRPPPTRYGGLISAVESGLGLTIDEVCKCAAAWHRLPSQDGAGTSHSFTDQTEQPDINTRWHRWQVPDMVYVAAVVNAPASLDPLDRGQTEQPDSTPEHPTFSPPTVQVASAEQWPTETQRQDTSSKADASLGWVDDTSHAP